MGMAEVVTRIDTSHVYSTLPLQATGQLRILATTDLHMHLRGYNYVTDRSKPGQGLAGLATLINHARAEAKAFNRTCILVDNGDTWQGTPTADLLAQRAVTQEHPLITSLNAMQFDVIGLGNHDLDYGLSYTRQIAQRLEMPVLSSNLHGDLQAEIAPAALLDLALPDAEGGPPRRVTLGVLSVVPASTAIWNDSQLNGQADVEDPIACLRKAVPALRSLGADLVLVLAHMGFEGVQTNCPGSDKGALALANIPGVDAIIGGHTHRRFPGPDHAGTANIDVQNGTIGPIPAAMPGHAGSDLAVLDLDLACDAHGRWRVRAHQSTLRPHLPKTRPDPRIVALSARAHQATVDYLGEEIGKTDHVLHSYFSFVQPTGTAALVARAKARVVRAGLIGTVDAELPLLAAVSAHDAGGRSGPDNYLHIPKGRVLRRHLAGLCPYPNQICALRVTGAELHCWLEHSALIYAAPDTEMLLNPDVPGFNFDTIYGLNYMIDPSLPTGTRIRDLTYAGDQVREDQMFILATNQFRVAGGGGLPRLSFDRIVLRSPVNQQDALIRALAASDKWIWEDEQPWRLARTVRRKAVVETSPEALCYLDEIHQFAPEVLEQTDAGFIRLALML